MTVHRFYRRQVAPMTPEQAIAALCAELPPELHELAALLPAMVSTREAARHCGCTERTIRDRIARRELVALGGRRIMIPRPTLLRWLAKRLTAVAGD